MNLITRLGITIGGAKHDQAERQPLQKINAARKEVKVAIREEAAVIGLAFKALRDPELDERVAHALRTQPAVVDQDGNDATEHFDELVERMDKEVPEPELQTVEDVDAYMTA